MAAGILILLLSIRVHRGSPGLVEIIAFSAALGFLASIHLPAYRSVVPSLVSREELDTASACTSAVNALTTVVGPALGVLFMLRGGAALCLFVNGLSFVVAAVCIMPVQLKPEHAQSIRTSTIANGLIGKLMESFTSLSSLPSIRNSIGAGAVVTLLVDASLAVLLPSISAELGMGPWLVGASAAAIGAGTVVSSALLPRLKREPLTIYYSFMAAAGLPVVVGLATHCPSAWLIGMGLYGALVGSRYMKYTLIQRDVPGPLLGRVSSVDSFVLLGLTSLGYLLMGGMVSVVSINALVAVCAVVNVVGVLAFSRLDRT